MPCALLSLGLLVASPLALAANKYLTPSGAGSQNGTSWANAYPLSQFQSVVTGLAAGDTLNLGSGTYNMTSPINVIGSGTSGSPKVIQGVDTGGGLPLFQGNYNPNNSASDATSFFLFGTGTIAHWQFKDFRIHSYSRGFRLFGSGTTYTLRTNLLWDNVDADTVEDFIQIYNASNVTIKNCDVIRYCKKAFRYGDYTMQITFDTCTADAKGAPLFADDLPLGQDSSNFPTRSIPAGFQGMDVGIHDITFIDCVARNNRYYPQDNGDSGYWNGDGFVSEEGTYNVTYIRCKAFNNHDGGFDDKADNLTYTDCIAIGNGKGFRYWGNNGTLINCLAAYNKAYNYPNQNNSAGLWVGGPSNGSRPPGIAHVYGSTFHNNFKFSLETYVGGTIDIHDSILSNKEGPEFPSNYFDNTYMYSSSGVTLTNVKLYHVDRGHMTDPLYVAASRTWEGSPADAYNSAVYSPDEGYFGLGGGGGTPVVTIAATDASAGEPSSNGLFTLTASPAPTSPITVNLTSTGTATNGTDYASIGGTVSIGTSGTATVAVTVTNDSTIEGSETVILTVASGTGYTVGSPSSATVTITDDDAPATPVVTIAATDASAGEPSNNGLFTLTVSPAPASPITVNLTRTGTATNGTDYASIGSTVSIGTSGTATVAVTVTDDSAVEGSETVILTVASGTGYAVGSPSSATVTIADDEASSAIAFRAAASASTGTTSGANSLVIAKPAGVVSGDLLVAALSVTNSHTITPPSGWTFVRTLEDTLRLHLYQKIAGASEPSSYTWSLSTTRRMAGGIVAFSGVSATSPLQAENGQIEPSTTTAHATPTLATTGTSTWLVSIFGDRKAGGSTWTPPSGTTELLNLRCTSGSDDPSLTIVTVGPVGAGSYTHTATASLSSSNACMEIIALQP